MLSRRAPPAGSRFIDDVAYEIVRPQQQIKARFDFQNLLVDGIYTLDVLVTGEISGKEVVLHGILNATILRIEPGNAENGRGLVRLIKPVHENNSPNKGQG